MNLKFKKMVPKKSYKHVVEEIQTAICNGELKAGERLPPEMKLKEIFDTSRGTVREALRVLEQKGLVSIKTGVKGGAMVNEANTQAMSDSMALLIRHQKISLRHLAQFRRLVEGYVAEQAALLACEGDIKKLERIISEIRILIRTKPLEWKQFHRLDGKFHRALAAVVGNPLMEANLQTIHGNIEIYFQHYLPFSQTLLEEDFNDLRKIFNAVSNRDGKEAGRIARHHVSRFTALMEENIKLHPELNFQEIVSG